MHAMKRERDTEPAIKGIKQDSKQQLFYERSRFEFASLRQKVFVDMYIFTMCM